MVVDIIAGVCYQKVLSALRRVARPASADRRWSPAACDQCHDPDCRRIGYRSAGVPLPATILPVSADGAAMECDATSLLDAGISDDDLLRATRAFEESAGDEDDGAGPSDVSALSDAALLSAAVSMGL